ncbi:dihydroorotase [Neorhizobium petrolearium]|uniref:Amidohydrolase family protein n=1 Tax=Neorhizobium petrolearium TaxID=515361 RepID=A0ABY8MAD0_9HYPH|nr:amidohydrolase family protein [Neorhizobium petrolearium]MCC2610581.1 amidohydrolase family protein [Neorhizobium petrolearium]WGI70719.1 amidohydrolase family protein [Neorhizobium petrolearium]
MADFDLVLKGTLVLPDSVVPEGHVAIRDGLVAAVGQGDMPAAKERQDLGKALILPGAIDAQVHSLSQKNQEDFIWSTRAAAAGGVTTIVDMPYDEGNLICSAEAVRGKATHVESQARVDFALYGTIDPEEGARRIPEQVEAGVAAFKFSTFGTDPKRFPRIPAPLMAECFAAIAPTGLTAGVHNENDEYVRAAMEKVKASGITDYRAHEMSRPPLTELLAMVEIYEIGAATGCPAHVVHCSLGRGYEIAAAYRAQGHRATVECLIHYLTLDSETDAKRLGGRSKCNPPIRPRAEVEKLWRHIAAGNVTLLSTDHVSWSLDRKTNPDMLANASGLPGLEAMVPLFVKGALERGVPLTWAARLMALNPARHFRIDHIKGALEVGKHADIAVLTPERHVFDASRTGSNVVGWSPYDGMTLPYKVAATYLRGKLAYDGSKVLAEPGNGNFVRPLASLPLQGLSV